MQFTEDQHEERQRYYKALDDSILPQEEYVKKRKAELIQEIYRLIPRSPYLSMRNIHRWQKAPLLGLLKNIRQNGVEAYQPYAPGDWI